MTKRQPSLTPYIKKSGPIPKRPPRRFSPPPAPPAPDLPTRDSSRKSHSKAPHRFPLWDFAKYRWHSLDQHDKESCGFIGAMFWFVFWLFSGIFAIQTPVVFMIPWIILSLIGMGVVTIIVKQLVKGAWNKYFPEYQEFKQEYKLQCKKGRILYGDVPQWFKDEMNSRPFHQRESFNHPPPEVAHTPYEWIDGESSGREYGAWRPVEQMTEGDELFESLKTLNRERGTDHTMGGGGTRK